MLRGQNIQVFVRCRPLGDRERKSVVDVNPERREIVFTDNQQELRNFYFDQVFSPQAAQLEVYRKVVNPLIAQVLQGFNCTVFAYGQTGTGKTYTMEGVLSDEELGWEQDPDAGIIPRAISQLLDTLKSQCAQYVVKVSFLELYNEDAYDLLSHPEDTTKLKVYDDATRKGSVIVGGLEEVTVQSKAEIFEILSRGSHKRQKASTLLNACSSRSHTIFTVNVNINDGSIHGKLNLVDLAGSENVGRSGAQDKRAREAGNINQSLLTLSRVITALVERRPHIPYRESKLTRLLQDSLGGSANTSIIATISPADSDCSDTLSTLDYATRARNVINKPESNQRSNAARTAVEQEREIQALIDRHSIELCETEFKVRNEVALEFKREMEKMKQTYEEQFKQRVDRMKEMSDQEIACFNNQLEALERNLKEKEKALELMEESMKQLQALMKEKDELLATEKSLRKERDDSLKKTQSNIQEKEDLLVKNDRILKDTETKINSLSEKVFKLTQENEEYKKLLQESNKQNKKYPQECEQLTRRVDKLKEEISEYKRNYKVLNELADYRKDLTEDLESKLRDKERALAQANATIRDLNSRLDENIDTNEVKKASKVRKAPILEECGEYANLTFDGGDEITQMSAKKTRKKVVAGTKRRTVNHSLVCSGKKKKLTTNELDPELSPITDTITTQTTTRVTRSRATRRKLNF